MRISDWSSDVCSSDLRAVHPFGTAKPGTEIGDFYGVASGIFMMGDEHGGVPHIMLARRNAVLKVDLPEAARAFARRWAVVEQRREYGIAINARHAGDRKSTRLNSSH